MARRERNKMKKSLLAIALALAISPLTFAQNNPPSGTTARKNTKKKGKKGKQPSKKGSGSTTPK